MNLAESCVYANEVFEWSKEVSAKNNEDCGAIKDKLKEIQKAQKEVEEMDCGILEKRKQRSVVTLLRCAFTGASKTMSNFLDSEKDAKTKADNLEKRRKEVKAETARLAEEAKAERLRRIANKEISEKENQELIADAIQRIDEERKAKAKGNPAFQKGKPNPYMKKEESVTK